jgi:Flp pilus assembly protein TadG
MDPAIAAIVVALIGLGGTVIGVLIGGRISGQAARDAAKAAADATREAALIAQREAQTDREEAQRVRLAEVVRQLASEVLRAGQAYKEQVQAEMKWRAGTGSPPAAATAWAGPPEAMGLWCQELRLVVRKPPTADTVTASDAAMIFYSTTRSLRRFALNPERDLLPDGTVELLAEGEWMPWEGAYQRWEEHQRMFITVVRTELGVNLVPPPGHD